MTQRDWQKDMEMCKAATSGPWKVFAKGLETLIGTEYDHPQLQAPDSIVGHAYGVNGEYVYIREDDAKLLAEARTALPYWLQEAARLKGYADVAYAEYERTYLREQRLKEAAEKVSEVYEAEYTDEEAVNAINDMFLDLLSTLYPDTPAPKEGTADDEPI